MYSMPLRDVQFTRMDSGAISASLNDFRVRNHLFAIGQWHTSQQSGEVIIMLQYWGRKMLILKLLGHSAPN